VKRNRSTFFLIAASGSAVCTILFSVALVRYIGRLPDDWVGIGLYSAAVIAFGISVFGFYIRWRAEKAREKQQQPADQNDVR